jgi:hypothetical protein
MSVARRAETVMAPGASSASAAGSVAVPGVKSTANARRRTAALSRFGPLLLIAVLVVFWEAGVRVFNVPNFLLPAPSEIVSLSIRDWPLLQMHTLVTLKVIVTGYWRRRRSRWRSRR